jgi:GT2 family glycosyltransferase
MNNISLLVGLKNNLDYNKHFYSTTRELYPDIEICFSSYNSTDGTNEWLQEIQFKDPNTKCWWSELTGNFSDNFNKAASLATKEYVAYLHNDIVLAPGFLENLEKHISPNNVVSYTTIEPPIFSDHERPGKIVKDFGIDLETFNLPELYKFILDKQEKFKNQTEPGITFFMCMSKATLLKIGGLDNLFNPMFCEDDDLILRFKLLGLNLFTSLDAICYHFVSKTSRFSEENKNKTQIIELNSNKNFIRKWGFRHSKYNKRYNIAYVVDKCNYDMMAALEPWCDRLYTDDEMGVLFAYYYENEQKNTSYDLKKRILTSKFNDPIGENDIIVEFDGTQLTNNSFNILQQLPDIITESGEVGIFELDIFKITIHKIESLTNNLIFISNN